MQRTRTANSVSPAQFRPEYALSARPICQRAAHSQSSLPPDANGARFSHACPVEATAKAAAQSAVALIEAEFKNNRRFYEYKLRCAGVAWHELPDALCEMFALAVMWAQSYDPSKSGISSWLGNQVVRTVASSILGSRRPNWRHQQERELSAEALMTDAAQDSSEMTINSFVSAGAQVDDLNVVAFLNKLSTELTPTETTVIDICGVDLLHERLTAAQLVQVRELLNVRSLTTVRAFTQKLGGKMRKLALAYFDAQDLVGRPGFDKWAA
ncbi:MULTISPECIES: hypothetical protein [unclassified Caballeronia]|uniref:hypothetical protein n=1 Tax=unclassified Caballeronia TaxID=2646786 RepID=UPI002027A347|nr:MULTISPECIES: hypothetical protein [unclassified Caballeronia]